MRDKLLVIVVAVFFLALLYYRGEIASKMEEVIKSLPEMPENEKKIILLLGMFAESSFLPVPSEVFIFGAAFAGVKVYDIVWIGTLGSVLGSAVGYQLGRVGAKAIDEYGKYIGVTTGKIEKYRGIIDEWGGKGVFLARLAPTIPFKVVSITSGLLKVDLKAFLMYTALGTPVRCALLAVLGKGALESNLMLVVSTAVVIAFLSLVVWREFRKKSRGS